MQFALISSPYEFVPHGVPAERAKGERTTAEDTTAEETTAEVRESAADLEPLVVPMDRSALHTTYVAFGLSALVVVLALAASGLARRDNVAASATASSTTGAAATTATWPRAVVSAVPAPADTTSDSRATDTKTSDTKAPAKRRVRDRATRGHN